MSLPPLPLSTVPLFCPRGARSIGRRLSRSLVDDRGAATAEYAVVIMAAVGFAGLLVAILRSGEVEAILTGLVKSALTVG